MDSYKLIPGMEMVNNNVFQLALISEDGTLTLSNVVTGLPEILSGGEKYTIFSKGKYSGGISWKPCYWLINGNLNNDIYI